MLVSQNAKIALIHPIAILAMMNTIYPLINAIYVHQNAKSALIHPIVILAILVSNYPRINA